MAQGNRLRLRAATEVHVISGDHDAGNVSPPHQPRSALACRGRGVPTHQLWRQRVLRVGCHALGSRLAPSSLQLLPAVGREDIRDVIVVCDHCAGLREQAVDDLREQVHVAVCVALDGRYCLVVVELQGVASP